MRAKRTLLTLACLACYGCTRTVVIEAPPAAPVPPAASSSPAARSAAASSAAAAAEASSSAQPPASVRIAVPFVVQAPFRNWDALHEETCEEASLIMVERFLTGKGALSEEESEAELQRLVAWQTARGIPWDIGVEDLLRTARDFYGLDGRIEENVTEGRMKELLAQGLPVIVPAAGRRLGNPYFSGDGPWYHMLVVTGYDGDTAVTNDPGTRRGEAYRYPFATLVAAVHDWTGVKEDIETGPRRMLILWKK